MKILYAAGLLVGMGLFACQKPLVPVDIQADVKSSQGQAVEGAVVSINGQDIGRTGKDGKFSHKISFEAETPLKIQITKESDTHYYAPFYHNLTVPSDGSIHLPIAATLYYVPKPTPQTVAEEKPSAEKPEASEVLTTDVGTPSKEASPAEATKPAEQTLPLEEVAEKAEPQPEPAPVAKTPETTVFTVHVFSSDRPVAKADVYWGETGKGNLKKGCTTNKRGRCVMKFPAAPSDLVTFIAKKEHYQTGSRSVTVTQGGRLRFNLKRGMTIDVFAVTKTYNYTRGVPGVAVYIKGNKVGHTDQFGHLAYFYSGRKSDLVDVRMQTRRFLPEEYETDFVVSGPASLIRYMTPLTPPVVRLSLLSVRPAGKLAAGSKQKAFDRSLDKLVKAAARKSVFSRDAFKEYAQSRFAKRTERLGRTEASMIRKGWAATDLKGSVDAVLLPTLIMSNPRVLELSVIDSRGRTLAAAKESLSGSSDKDAIDHAVNVISKKLARSFPFEGAVLGQDDNQITVNLGLASGRDIRVGDLVEVHGMQSGEFGQKQSHRRIATLRVKEVWDQLSRCEVVDLAKRSTIHRGDLVVLRSQARRAVASTKVKVLGREPSGRVGPVAQANVYFNERWVGASDASGLVKVPKSLEGKTGSLKAVKHGYKNFSREMRLSSRRTISLTLKRAMAFVRVDSKPQNVPVLVDGKKIGVTPLAKPISVPSGFVKVELQAPEGYKNYATVLDLEDGTVELIGAQAVKLEEDLLANAKTLVKKQRYNEAVEKLAAVPSRHSDYLEASHLRGELLLNRLREPAKAALAFGAVTGDERVKNFNDKRFIASHINEGIALFKAGEGVASSDSEAAASYFLRAVEAFKRVQPFIRFVPKHHFARAVHNVAYHTALGKQKLWDITKNPTYLNGAFKDWRTYLSSYKSSPLRDADSQTFLKNARVYLKQTEGSLAALQAEELN